MNIQSSKKGLLAMIAVWLVIFLSLSVLSGVANSIADEASTDKPSDSKTTPAVTTTAPSTTTEAPPSTEPPVDNSPYGSLTYSAENAQYLIFLDAGHGWYDNGSSVKINENGEYDENGDYIYEKDINLQLTKKLKQALEKMGYTVGETRPGDMESDCPVELVNGIFYAQSRPAYVNAQNPHYFISIHCNTFTDPSVSGTRIYYSEKLSENRKFAATLMDTLSYEMGIESTLHTDNLAITRESAMPTVLIETGFITNMDDLQNLMNPDWQDQFVCALARGLDAQVHS